MSRIIFCPLLDRVRVLCLLFRFVAFDSLLLRCLPFNRIFSCAFGQDRVEAFFPLALCLFRPAKREFLCLFLLS